MTPSCRKTIEVTIDVMIKKSIGPSQFPTQVFSLEADGQKIRYLISSVVVVSLMPLRWL